MLEARIASFFRPENGRLVWSKEEISANEFKFHGPQVHALNLASACDDNGFEMHPTEYAPKLIGTCKYPWGSGFVGIVDQLDINPSESLGLFVENNDHTIASVVETFPEGVSETISQIRERISQAKRYLLAGAISTPAILDLLDRTYKLGFRGELWVMDISAKVLELSAIYWEEDWIKKYPGVELHTLKADLTCIETSRLENQISQRNVVIGEDTLTITTVPKGYFDIVQMDVLGTYITEHWERDMPRLGDTLNKDGMVIACDMEEYRKPNVKIASDIPDNSLLRNIRWIKERFQIDPDTEGIIQEWKTKFDRVKTSAEERTLGTMWEGEYHQMFPTLQGRMHFRLAPLKYCPDNMLDMDYRLPDRVFSYMAMFNSG